MLHRTAKAIHKTNNHSKRNLIFISSKGNVGSPRAKLAGTIFRCSGWW